MIAALQHSDMGEGIKFQAKYLLPVLVLVQHFDSGTITLAFCMEGIIPFKVSAVSVDGES